MNELEKLEHVHHVLQEIQNGQGDWDEVEAALLTIEDLREPFLSENADDMLKVDGLDRAIIGIGRQFSQQFFVYDYDKCIEVFMTRDDMSEEDAREWMEVNVVGAYMGPGTPTYVITGEDFEKALEIQSEIRAAPRLRGGQVLREDE